MRDAINEFVQFISDDPLMLGLCLAIVALVIIFIIVLIFGGKSKEDAENKVQDNTTELLKNDIDNEPLKSTQEFNLENLKKDEVEKTQQVPNIDVISEDEAQKNAPISVDEALELKNKMEDNLVKDTIPIPVVESAPVMPLEIKIPSVEESEPVSPIPTIETFEVPSEQLFKPNEVAPEPVESSIPEIKNDIFEPVQGTQPFSSVYINSSEEMPKPEVISTPTDIIRHNPTPPSVSPIALASTPIKNVENIIEDNDDDIDLPKLSSEGSKSISDTLVGESFNIK